MVKTNLIYPILPSIIKAYPDNIFSSKDFAGVKNRRKKSEKKINVLNFLSRYCCLTGS